MPFREHSEHDFSVETNRNIYNETRNYGRSLHANDTPPLTQASDDLVWAIEAVINEPMSIKRWFLVKDALKKYKDIRNDIF